MGTGGALCAVHADRQASETCARCGAFMCETCTEYGDFDTCPTCRERTGTGDWPYERSGMDLGDILQFAWDKFQPQWLQISLAQLIFYGVLMTFNFITQFLQVGAAAVDNSGAAVGFVMFGAMILQQVATGVLTLGIIAVSFDALRGETIDLSRIFSQLGKLGKYLVQLLVMIAVFLIPAGLVGLMVAGAIAAFQPSEMPFDVPETMGYVLIAAATVSVIPLIWLGMGFTFMTQELVFDDSVGAVEAIKRSFTVIKGFRLWAIALGFVMGLLSIAGMLACCVGILPAMGLAQMMLCAFYFTLRNGSGLPAPVRA